MLFLKSTTINHFSANIDHQTMPQVGILIFLTCQTIVSLGGSYERFSISRDPVVKSGDWTSLRLTSRPGRHRTGYIPARSGTYYKSRERLMSVVPKTAGLVSPGGMQTPLSPGDRNLSPGVGGWVAFNANIPATMAPLVWSVRLPQHGMSLLAL